MRAGLWLVGFLMVAPLGAQHVRVETPAGTVTIDVEGQPGKRVRSRAIIRAVDRRLDRLETLLRRGDRRSRREALQLVREIRGLVHLLPENAWIPVIVEEPDVRVRVSEEAPVISEHALESLLERLEDASFAEDQLNILRTAAKHNRFRTEQVLRILKVFSFEEDRLKAVRILRSRIVDPENLHALYEAFDFSDSREELEDLLDE